MTGLLSLTSALWLGILMSISPCPLATNIAAISFVVRRVNNLAAVLLSGLLYTIGRAITYTVVASLIVNSILSIPEAANFLQKYMNEIMGPLLILVGMFLVGLIRLPGGSGMATDKLQRRVESWGVWGAGLLGVVFAMTFCPLSAVLFFGSLIPMAIEANSTILLPVAFGIGSGLPVLLFAMVIALSAKALGGLYVRIGLIEQWSRFITGGIIIMIGIYLCLRYIFRII
ncbi:MAG TPA: aromatic aminobenezylarsenical efflux permease ArsG family transporter [candidate division Zixibacteria bacterium]|nr:aromatic aminobenezylarsenical efflux permease ArsG family transporter [candidate division Zixibacteria bacterium]